MITTDRPDNPVRCRKGGRLGSPLPGRKDWGPMEPVGVPTTYKHSGNNGGRISNKSFYKNQKAKEFTSSKRQHSSPKLHIENGKHQERDSDQICKEDLGIPVTGRDHDYCGIPPGYSEQNSERRIQENPKGGQHPLGETLRLGAWLISGISTLQKEFQKRQPSLSQVQELEVQRRLTNRPGDGGAAGVVKGKLILFDALSKI